MSGQTNSFYEEGYDDGYRHGAYSVMQMMAEFHKAFGHEISEPWNEDLATLRANLVAEEANELVEALGSDDREHLAKEIADALYVTLGTALALGIDPIKAFTAVHRSNMSKLDDDGKPRYRSDGKVLKSANYRPPNMGPAVRRLA